MAAAATRWRRPACAALSALQNAGIGGVLSFAGATIANPGGEALTADGLKVEQPMFCREGFSAQGKVSLTGARIGGRGAEPLPFQQSFRRDSEWCAPRASQNEVDGRQTGQIDCVRDENL